MICSNCDYVLDPSFFTAGDGASTAMAERSSTPVETAAPVASARPTPQKAPAPPRAEPRAEARAAPRAAAASATAAVPAARPRLVEPDAEDDQNAVSAPAAALEDLWKDLRGLRGELKQPDQLAFFGALTQLLWLFLPWKETAGEGAVLGLATIGAVILLGAGATAAAVLFRHRRLKPDLDPLAPWLVQIGGACFMVFWSLFSVRLMWDGRKVPGLESLQVEVSRPSFGAYVALLSGMVSLVGSLWGLRNKVS